MIYKDRKIREMLRSILPSTRRKTARLDKAAAKRANRHNIKQMLVDHKGFALQDDNDDSSLVMKIHYGDQRQARDIRYAVQHRRDADKIGSFVRWAERLTKDIEDKRSKRERFISIIGGNRDLIRDHAIGHFISPWELNPINDWISRDDEPDVHISREQFTEAMNKALEIFTLETLDDIISPERSDGSRYYPHRWKKCKVKKHSCMEESVRRTLCITHILGPDGQKKRIFCRWIDISDVPLSKMDRHIPTGASYYIRESMKTEHNPDICRNRVRLDKPAQAKSVIRFIFGKRNGMKYHSKRYLNGRKALASEFHKFFVMNNIW